MLPPSSWPYPKSVDGSSDISVGERIRFYRQAQKKTQAVVAGLAGVTEDYLSQIERGLKTPSTMLLHRLARILKVPTSALFGEAPAGDATPGHPMSTAIHTALAAGALSDGATPDLLSLRARVDAAWSTWQESSHRYSQLGPLLPTLIVETEAATRAQRASNDATGLRQAYRISADLYFLLRTFTKRIGRTDLSLLVADRALKAAEAADDLLRVAAAKWNLGQVLLAANEPHVAEQVAANAIGELDADVKPARDRAALSGALWLLAAIAAARAGDAWTARDRLRDHAYPIAAKTGEGNVFWTVFGPTNTALHAVSIEAEAGEAGQALRLADGVDLTRCPSIERRATFALELARCYDQRHDDPGVLLHLLAAYDEAPEDMLHNVLARELVRGLLRRARPSLAPRVRDLARQIELFA